MFVRAPEGYLAERDFSYGVTSPTLGAYFKRQMLLARYRREHKDDTSYLKEVQAEPARPE